MKVSRPLASLVPIKTWATGVEPSAWEKIENTASLPFVLHNGIAIMPDAHDGIGAVVGSVVPTKGAIIPACVGVDIGCGMSAVKLSLKADSLPDSLALIRNGIERDIPLGPGGAHQKRKDEDTWFSFTSAPENVAEIVGLKAMVKAELQLGTLGSGNHFIELCLDEESNVWVMLHSGSRGIGNQIGRHYIELAKKDMERWFIHLPDADLAYFPEGSDHFDAYMKAVGWAQDYALENRRRMMEAVLQVLTRRLPPFTLAAEAIQCHHNYVARENHFGKNVYVTRKGAIRAREGDLGIIPGSMGQKSYIVRGKGNLDSYCSCSHGAGRRMSRAQAKKQFTVQDLEQQTQGVECRKDAGVLDELPSAYKDLDEVMANQTDLVEIVHTLKAVLCVKGN